MSDYFENGNATIHSLKLVNYRGQEHDITGIFSYIELYEDIFSSTLSARIGIEDSVDLFQNFPIIGKEKLIFEYSTQGLPKVRVELSVYDIPSRYEIKIKHQVYTMSFMSEEGLRNQYASLNRSLSGNIEDSIKDILANELGSDKEVVSDAISNSITFIPNKQKPFETINTLTTRAISAKSATHVDYLFYETVDGYSLKSINSLVVEPTVATYKFSRLNKESDESPLEDDFYVIGNYEVVQESSPVTAIAGGKYGGTLGTYDPVTRTYKETTYSIVDNRDDFNFLSDHLKLPKNNTEEQTYKDHSYKYLIAGSKETTLLHRNAKFEQLFNTVKIVADVAGNSDLRVGQVIELNVPSNTTDDIEKHIKERFLKGKYLITSLKHSFKVGIGGYRTIVELCKDSIDIPVEDTEKLFDRLGGDDVVL